MHYAPIALFVYKRLWHAQQTIFALQNNPEAKDSDLYVYSDGPKDKENEPAVKTLREWLGTISGFKSVNLQYRDQNLGLARSIIQGVTELVSRFNKVIVVEDDLVVSPYFLKFMNESLHLYEEDESVASIHGYSLPTKDQLPDLYFLRGADCWGWATWERAWQKFEPDGVKLLNSLKAKDLLKAFNFQGSAQYSQMLKDQIKGKNNSWAIRWYASAFIHNMYTLYPGISLVQNIGFDGSGEHCLAMSAFDTDITNEPIIVSRIPIEQNKIAFDSYVRYFKQFKEPWSQKILRQFKKIRLKIKSGSVC